jgi:hypothetical protein
MLLLSALSESARSGPNWPQTESAPRSVLRLQEPIKRAFSEYVNNPEAVQNLDIGVSFAI